MASEGEIQIIEGYLEHHNLSAGTPVQLERIGYGIISDNGDVFFTHN